jgi:hypothetical protein
MKVVNINMPTRLTCSLSSSAEAVRIYIYTIIIGLVCCSPPHIHPSLLAVHAQEEVRRGPTSVSEFEVSLADIYKGASIDVRPVLFFVIPLPATSTSIHPIPRSHLIFFFLFLKYKPAILTFFCLPKKNIVHDQKACIV